MTFDPRWLNQIPLYSMNGGDINSLVSLTGSTGLDVAEWNQSVALANIAISGGQALSTAKLRSGNLLVAYADTNYKVAVVNPAGSVVVSAVTIAPAASGNYLKAATLANGNVVIAFYEVATPRIRFIIYDERLNVIKNSTVVAGTGGFTRFSVTSLADGNFVIGYANGSSKNAFQIFDQDGDVVRTEVIVSTTNVDRNEVVGLQNGNFMVFVTNSTSAWYYIYDRQGIQVLGATSLGSIGTLVDYPTTLLSNGHVVYAYNNSNNLGIGIIDSNGNETVTSTIIATTAKAGGSLFALPNNMFGFAYKNTSGTAAYFQIRDSLNASVKAETAFGGSWTSLTSLTTGVFSSGEFLFLAVDTDVKRTIWAGSKAKFSNDLQILGDFSLASGIAVNEISNSPLTSSTTTLPTAYAVKLYVDQQTGNVPRNYITEGDSKVEVQDSTSELTQYVTFVLNGAEVSRMEDTGTAKVITLGPSGDTRAVIDTGQDIIKLYPNNLEIASFSANLQKIGTSASVEVVQDAQTISFLIDNTSHGNFTSLGFKLNDGIFVNEFSDDVSLGGYNGALGSNEKVPTQKAVRSYIDEINNLTQEPTGFPAVSRNTSVITFGQDATNEFKISPTSGSYVIFLKGQRYVINSAKTIQISDVEGIHFIYFNSSGVLSETTTFSYDLIFNFAYVAAVYWDATNKRAIYVGDERHGVTMDGRTHINLHESQGTVYISGLGIGDIVPDGTGSTNVEAQLSVSSGVILDEDLFHNINALTAPAQIPMFYRSGAGNGVWRKQDATNFPLINAGSGRVAWNKYIGGSWQLSEATNNSFVLVHIFATNDLYQEVIGIVGQNEYLTIADAREGAANELNTLVLAGLPFQEFVAIGTVIFQTSDSFSNDPKAVIRTTDLGANYVDWRFSKVSSVPGTITDHGALSGLGDDDHFQYARTDGTRPITGLQFFQSGITLSGGSLTLPTGASVNNISTNTLLGTSNTTLVTQNAVKTYVDTQIANLNPDKIWAGNSKVEVIDDSTNTGYVQIVTDGVQVAYFDSLATTQRIGKATESRLLVADNTVKVYAGATPVEVGYFGGDKVVIGDVNRVYFRSDLDNNELFLSTSIGQKGSVKSDRVWFGDNGTNAGIDINTGDKTTKIYAGDAPDLVKILLDSTSASMFINADDTVFYATADTFGVGNPNASAGAAWILGNTAGIKVIDVSSTNQIALFDSTGLQLATGVKINKFSDDNTLGETTPSNNIVPTQAAVKTYVDTQIGNQANRIWEGNSEVRVTDTGTGSIVTKADNTDVQSLTLNTQRVGQATSSRVELVVSPNPTATIYAGANNVFEASNTSVVVGHSTDTRITLNQSSDIVTFYAGNTNVAELSLTTLRIGQVADSRLVLDTINDYANLYAGATQIIDGATNTQIFGVAGDSRLFLDQANNYADLYAGTNRIVRGESNLQVFGVSGDSRLETDQTNDTIDLYAGNVKVINSTTNVLTLGKSGDTYITLNQQDDLINTYTGNVLQMQVENSGVSIEGDLTVRGNLSIDGTAFIVFNEEVSTQDNIITVNYGDPGPGVTRGIAGLEVDRGSLQKYQFIFQETTDTFRVGEVGQTQAVATREDDPDGYKVPWWDDDYRMFKTLGSEYIKIDQTSNNILFVTGLTQRAKIDSEGLTLQLGTSVNEFSTDGTLFGNSDDAVPTEKAVKTYVDTQIGGQANIIFQNNSKVEVLDDGTNAGAIFVWADAQPVATFMQTYQNIGIPINHLVLQNDDINSLYDSKLDTGGFGIVAHNESGNNYVRVGSSAGTNGLTYFYDETVPGSNYINVTLQNASLVDVVPLLITPSSQRLGPATGGTQLSVGGNTVSLGRPDSTYYMSMNPAETSFTIADTVVLTVNDSFQRLGKPQSAGRVITSENSVEVYDKNAARNVYITTTEQHFGKDVGTIIKLNQTTKTTTLYADETTIVSTFAQTSQTIGVSGDSRIVVNQAADTVNIYAGAKNLVSLATTSATFGNGDESRLTVTPTQATLYAGTTEVVSAIATSQTFGVSSDSRLYLDQQNDLADLYAGETQIIDGAPTTQIFGVSGDSRLVLDQTANTAKLYAGSTLVFDGGTNVVTIGTATDTNITIDQTGSIIFEANNTKYATINTSGLTLQTGASIVEFSTDGTLIDNSDTAVPTEKAVKTYVDTEINDLRQELDLINVRNVYADTTASTGDVILVDTTAGDVTIQLLESTDGKIIIKKKTTDSNKVYITTTPGLIDGQSQIIIDTGYQAYTFVCDGINFFII